MQAKRILILGAGFGGVYAYLALHNIFHTRKDTVAITLVSEGDYFAFVPMIHEVATGMLLPSSIKQSIRVIPQCCLHRFIEGKVHEVDADKRTVTVQDVNDTITYDYLIFALGSETNFFGVPGAEEYAFPLKNIDDAKRLKNRIVESFERAEVLNDENKKRRILRFSIVGGGPTGVELAGEIADLLHHELAYAFPALQQYAEVALFEKGPCLVAGMQAWFGEKSRAILEQKKQVQVRVNARIERITPEGVYSGKEFVPSGTVIWTAGVKAREFTLHAEKRVDRREHDERIRVNTYLQLCSYPEVYVVGDQAWIEDKEVSQPYPMRAQFAVREGETAAENIGHAIDGNPLKEFAWHDMGFTLSLGKGGALAEIFGIRLSGPFAWLLYRGAYLIKIVGVRAKFRTLLEWSLNVFFPRDISKL